MNDPTSAGAAGARRRSRRGAFALLALSALVGVGLAEVALRAVGPFERAGKTPDHVLWEPDPVIGLAPAAGLDLVFSTNEWVTRVRTDALGFRVGTHRPALQPDRSNIVLFLGDSATMAVQVPAESTFVGLIDGELGRRDLPVRAVNAGCNGFNTVQEYFFFKKLYDHGFRPRLVVLYATNNDLYEDVAGLPYAPYSIDTEGYLVQAPPDRGILEGLKAAKASPTPPVNFWLHHSAFLRHLWYAYRIVRNPYDVAGWVSGSYLRDDVDPLAGRRWAAVTAAVRSLNRLVTSYGGMLVIAVHPDPVEWSDGYFRRLTEAVPALANRIDRMKVQGGYRRVADREGVAFIDMLDGFPDVSVREFRFALDPHSNESGHRIIAMQLLKGLDRLGLL